MSGPVTQRIRGRYLELCTAYGDAQYRLGKIQKQQFALCDEIDGIRDEIDALNEVQPLVQSEEHLQAKRDEEEATRLVNAEPVGPTQAEYEVLLEAKVKPIIPQICDEQGHQFRKAEPGEATHCVLCGEQGEG